MNRENFHIQPVSLSQILPFRKLFLQESNCQIRYNACHERNWSDSYLIQVGQQAIGYGSIKGKDELIDRDTVFEFYILPTFRNLNEAAFEQLLKQSNAKYIESQSNLKPLTQLLHVFSSAVYSDVFLFEDYVNSNLTCPKAIFRQTVANDDVFGKEKDDVGAYVLEIRGEIVATGGFLLHYNEPFADLFMEVSQSKRLQGYGSYIIQEIKRECYLAKRIPAARCNIANKASKATLVKAGFRVCGQMLQGTL